jgi:hypothetical protein
MEHDQAYSIGACFAALEDPRVERTKWHSLEGENPSRYPLMVASRRKLVIVVQRLSSLTVLVTISKVE